ncbi:hypothetical protein KBB12_02040 [Candidatus Woesebacteria bacterium]|nr:hypothetical protein [Candidatus Woesebacteria bacterium]
MYKSDIKALKLASLFSYSPNHKGYCGRDSAGDAFTRCILNGDCAGVPEELTHFIVLYPYLKTLSIVTKLSPFDHRIIEAYWIGNDLLKSVPVSAYHILLKEFEKQGVPSWLIKSLKQKQPKAFIPSHLFQVLHVGVGQASGSVPFDIGSINSCMIRWGKVTRVDKSGKIHVALQRFSKTYKLTISSEIFAKNTSPFFTPKVGDTVAVHWGHIVKKLTQREIKNLAYWTQEALHSAVIEG